MSDESELLAWRAEFPTLEKSVHLISHSLGAMPRRAKERAAEFLRLWEDDSIEAWHTWLPFVDELGNRVARVLGVPEGTVIMNQNVSTVQAIVASCFDFAGPRKKIVYEELNFSTVHYVWQEQQRRGAELCVVKSDDGISVPTERMLEAIDERTLLVPLSHVLFRSSAKQDLEAIVKRAHEVGALVLADVYQSAGTVPLRLADWDVDMACGGSVKWICGGPGAAYLYVKPELRQRLQPTATGWFAHAEPFAFDMGPMRYADSPWRMLSGTPAMPALYTAAAGWEIIGEIGVEKIRKKSLRQTTLLRTLAEERGFRIRTPREDDRRGGTICFDFDGSQAVAKALNERHFFCDWRPTSGIRASPHFYTTDEDLHRFVAEIDRLRG